MQKKHFICDVLAISEYHDDFSDYPMDVDGDGRLGHRHRRMVGRDASLAPKSRRDRTQHGRRSTSTAAAASRRSVICDIDGCGVPEIFPNTPGSRRRSISSFAMPTAREPASFGNVVIGEGASGHGMGFVDVNGDGRMDIVLAAAGWSSRRIPLPDYGRSIRSSRSAAPACRCSAMT